MMVKQAPPPPEIVSEDFHTRLTDELRSPRRNEVGLICIDLCCEACAGVAERCLDGRFECREPRLAGTRIRLCTWGTVPDLVAATELAHESLAHMSEFAPSSCGPLRVSLVIASPHEDASGLLARTCRV